jgi:hypothetical protein
VPFTLKKADLNYDPPEDRTFANSWAWIDRSSLPQTVQDAMLVTELVGERYLQGLGYYYIIL